MKCGDIDGPVWEVQSGLPLDMMACPAVKPNTGMMLYYGNTTACMLTADGAQHDTVRHGKPYWYLYSC